MVFGDLFSQSYGYQLPATLNELGDFLAGIFAPIAFFWLILGYIQQGKQLDQNTTALEQQEKALQLQIDEMKESVQQQTELARIQQKQFDAMNYASNPNLLISSCECEIYSGGYSEEENEVNDLCRLYLTIFNKGIAEALDIRIEVNNKKFLISERVFVDEVIYLEPDLVKLSKNLDFLNVEFTLICANKFNSQIKEHYEIEVYFIEDSWETERVNIIKR
ncbi:hypothetical protein [Acinetobacter sp. ACNIH2]|uniref:hypothetical protein n=1 Tax=Acinetobacter sp. ACNIH2 TaxID=1758189 RepID=UPI001D175D07|nr:hypothetical protein [Acinetobacter sp. ACNIH2]